MPFLHPMSLLYGPDNLSGGTADRIADLSSPLGEECFLTVVLDSSELRKEVTLDSACAEKPFS